MPSEQDVIDTLTARGVVYTYDMNVLVQYILTFYSPTLDQVLAALVIAGLITEQEGAPTTPQSRVMTPAQEDEEERRMRRRRRASPQGSSPVIPISRPSPTTSATRARNSTHWSDKA